MPKRKKYLNWEEYFIAIAQVCSLRSKDPNTQVGVVIVNHRKEIVATGYNGLPWGLSDDIYPYEREGNWLETKYPYMVHAEANAIIHARQNCEGFTLYTTLFPCHECAKLIIQCGIKQVFYSSDKHHEKPETIAAKKMFDDARIRYSSIFPLEIVINKIVS
jgi:dCMP deaminase